MLPLIAVFPAVFAAGECGELRRYAEKSDYVPASVLGDDPNHDFRRGAVAFEAPELFGRVKERISQDVNELFDLLNCREGNYGKAPFWEIQVTSSGHGDYFATHTDDSQPGTEARVLSFVAYIGRGFTGGQLYFPGLRYRFPAAEGSLIVFESSLAHEIEPVSVPSRDFGSSRLTVNGWIR